MQWFHALFNCVCPGQCEINVTNFKTLNFTYTLKCSGKLRYWVPGASKINLQGKKVHQAVFLSNSIWPQKSHFTYTSLWQVHACVCVWIFSKDWGNATKLIIVSLSIRKDVIPFFSNQTITKLSLKLPELCKEILITSFAHYFPAWIRAGSGTREPLRLIRVNIYIITFLECFRYTKCTIHVGNLTFDPYWATQMVFYNSKCLSAISDPFFHL